MIYSTQNTKRKKNRNNETNFYFAKKEKKNGNSNIPWNIKDQFVNARRKPLERQFGIQIFKLCLKCNLFERHSVSDTYELKCPSTNNILGLTYVLCILKQYHI